MTGTGYSEHQPDRTEVDTLPGATLLVFGTDWCGYCRTAERPMRDALAEHPDVQVIKVEDGPGRPLGRAYGVQLWPSLIFLREGVEVERLVRPSTAEPIAAALTRIGEGRTSPQNSGAPAAHDGNTSP
ncbi:MAG: thioredoxin family protein [Gordonia sp. (in: high G+C Gram-positive bacteria)]|uniref:thioredoxin family protein n=1 Tax=Gordonia sp. (in: high G+C Gram-positive bacteria) TaxID=84139 RepID=UPI003BB6AED4